MSEKVCLWCGKPLSKRRRKYCSDECADKYFIERIAPLWWQNASQMALKRAGYKCEDCGSDGWLEVHHIISLGNGEPRHNSPKNKQENLKVLCRACHKKTHHPLKSMKPQQKCLIPQGQQVMEI